MMKNKPIKCGLKFYVLAEARTGYIHHAILHYSAPSMDGEVPSGAATDVGHKTFHLVIDLLEGVGLKDGYSFLDQGYIVSVFYQVNSENLEIPPLYPLV